MMHVTLSRDPRAIAAATTFIRAVIQIWPGCNLSQFCLPENIGDSIRAQEKPIVLAYLEVGRRGDGVLV
jgi:hypothetical protein